MESDAMNSTIRNDVLSQSYAECVERVAQQQKDVGVTFDLPKEVLEERAKVWDNFFEKYADEVPDDVELDMDTMEPVAATDSEGVDDEDDEEDDEDEKYYSKCRAPLRKLPALIQYWIDTGNPPYQLVGNDDNSVTGSSLSENEHSRSGHSAVSREASARHKSNTSRCSSVDTAAYILSNTNTTKKKETMAILEGAKISDEHLMSKASPHKRKLAESVDKTKSPISTSPNQGQKSPAKIHQVINPKALKISSEFKQMCTSTASKSTQANHSTDLASKLLDVSSQQSVKLSEILPELQEFDDMLAKANAMSAPKARSALASVRKKPKCVEPEIPVTKKGSQSSQEISILPRGPKKLLNRRKLYTGRDSPVDLTLNKTKETTEKHSIRRTLHPALETPKIPVDKITRLAARVRKRKRKRASQILAMNSQDGNTSQESDLSTGREKFRGDERYTDFFESLGLTPNKAAVAKYRLRKPSAKRSTKIERPILDRKAKNVAPTNDYLDSSLKESSHSDSDVSPVKRVRDSEKENVILGDKIISVRVEKLSDEFLARYNCLASGNTESEKFGRNELQVLSNSSISSSRKKDKRSKLETIELLTTMTHDSDSSTILICSCNDNIKPCDDDGKTSLKNVTQSQVDTLRMRGSKACTKPVNDGAKAKFIEHSDKLPFVQLERISVKNLPVNNLGGETKMDESVARKGSKFVFKTSLSPLSQQARSSLRKGEKIDLFGSKVNDVVIGSRIFDESNNTKSAKNSQGKYIATRARCSLGISIPSDEEENSFVKLIAEIGSQRNSTKVEEENHVNETKINRCETPNFSNEVGKIETRKPRKLFAVSTSSDEEDVYVSKAKRQTRNSDSRNHGKRRETRKMKENLFIEVNKNGGDVRLDNEIDGSKFRTSENAAENELRSNFDNGKTRASRSQRKMQNDALSAYDKVEEEVKVDDESRSRSGRRKNFKKPNSESKDETAMKVDDNRTRRSNGVRRSTRNKSSVSSLPENQAPVENLFANSKDTKTFSANSKESNLKDALVLSTEDDRDFRLKKTNLGAANIFAIAGQMEKSKNRVTTRVPQDEKKIVRNSLRFETRLDSDPDTEFRRDRISPNDTNIPPSPKNLRNKAGIAKSNEITSFKQDEPGIKAIETISTSPRRSFKSLLEEPENSGNELKKQRKKLFDDEAKSTGKKVGSFENGALETEVFWNNESSLLNEFPIERGKNSNEKQTKSKPEVESQLKRKTRNDSKKTNGLKNNSLLANQRNGKSLDSPIRKKKKREIPRIFGNTKDWESDDENDSNDDKISLRIDNQTKDLKSLVNGFRSNKSNKKDAIGDRESSRKHQSTNLFSNSPDEIAEDVDNLFSSVTKSRGARNGDLIPKLNFSNFTKHQNRSNIRLTSIRFRTKLRSDSEDDEE